MKPQRTGSAPSSAAIRATHTPWPAAWMWMSSPPAALKDSIAIETIGLGLKIATLGLAFIDGGRVGPGLGLGGGGSSSRILPRCERFPTQAARPQLARSLRRGAGAADPALLQRPHLRDALRARPLLPRPRGPGDRGEAPDPAPPARLV